MKPRHERLEILREAAGKWLTAEAAEMFEQAIDDAAKELHDLVECYGIAPARHNEHEGAACWIIFHQDGMSYADMHGDASWRDCGREPLCIIQGIEVDESKRLIVFDVGLHDDTTTSGYILPSLDLWRWASRLIVGRFEAYRLFEKELKEEMESLLSPKVRDEEGEESPLSSMVNWRTVGDALGDEFGSPGAAPVGDGSTPRPEAQQEPTAFYGIKSAAEAEEAAAAWLRRIGFHDVRASPPGPDSGIDVEGIHIAGQVKFQVTTVGRPILQQLVGAAPADKQLVLFALGGYTDQAFDYANERRISLFSLDHSGQPIPLSQAAFSMIEGKDWMSS